ncbi:MAG: OB-fold nucleic acid binding domain-containing protein [Actinomycetota bacterium]|nr:OB-fold nucleic acid binding domain-containing protein [Actinomycetota bacterium]
MTSHTGARLRRVIERLGTSQQELEARELQREVRSAGCCRIADAGDREHVHLAGTLKHVTLRPRSGTPALEAELYDGSGAVTLVWLGRRRIAGVEPGATLTVFGRLSRQGADRVMFNPRYELRP